LKVNLKSKGNIYAKGAKIKAKTWDGGIISFSEGGGGMTFGKI
jgi:hypothetical protein